MAGALKVYVTTCVDRDESMRDYDHDDLLWAGSVYATLEAAKADVVNELKENWADYLEQEDLPLLQGLPQPMPELRWKGPENVAYGPREVMAWTLEPEDGAVDGVMWFPDTYRITEREVEGLPATQKEDSGCPTST